MSGQLQENGWGQWRELLIDQLDLQTFQTNWQIVFSRISTINLFKYQRLFLFDNFLFNKKNKGKNMDSNLPPANLPMRGPPNPQMMGNFGPNPNMGNVPFGGMPKGMPMSMGPPLGLGPEFEKKKEFARGVYVSGFERTLTPEMLQEHFKIKIIHGLKMPMSKFNENKGFAFIYYGSDDDAREVKRKLDHSVILRNKIRVTRIVVAENLSKMMFKLKHNNMDEEEIKEVEKRYFNEQNLQNQVSRIIKDIFLDSIEVNKIVIPMSKKDKNVPLKYARVFFYVSNLKEAGRTAKAQKDPMDPTKDDKNQYEHVLGYIVDRLNQNEDFKKYVKAEIYEYSKKNQSNVLHFKGISYEKGEDPAALAEDLKAFIQSQCRQSSVKGCYAAAFEGKAAWANVTFGSYEETLQAYDLFKNNRITFRDKFLYANLRNVKDPRTVVISTVRKEANEKLMQKFLAQLANRSARIEGDETKGRKYDYFSFNIVNQKRYFIDSDNKSVCVDENDKVEEFWRYNNSVPKRVVIHFMNEIRDEDIRDLINDIKMQDGWDQLFHEKDAKNPIRANHQKGHIEGERYIKHADNKGGKKKGRMAQGRREPGPKNMNRPDQRRPIPGPTQPGLDYTQFKVLNKPSGQGPKFNKGPGGPSMGSKPYANFSKPTGMPGMGVPPMGGSKPPMMGQPMMGQQPSMGQTPPMGSKVPPMPGQGKPPMMGQFGMGQPGMGQMGQPGMGQMGQPGMGQPGMGQSMGPPPMGQMGSKPPGSGQMPPRQDDRKQ